MVYVEDSHQYTITFVYMIYGEQRLCQPIHNTRLIGEGNVRWFHKDSHLVERRHCIRVECLSMRHGAFLRCCETCVLWVLLALIRHRSIRFLK